MNMTHKLNQCSTVHSNKLDITLTVQEVLQYDFQFNPVHGELHIYKA